MNIEVRSATLQAALVMGRLEPLPSLLRRSRPLRRGIMSRYIEGDQGREAREVVGMILESMRLRYSHVFYDCTCYDPINRSTNTLLPHHDASRLVPLVGRGHWDTSGPRIPTDEHNGLRRFVSFHP